MTDLLTLATLAEVHWAFWLAPIGGVCALAMAYVLASSVLKRSEGEPEMVRIAAAVRQGAMAYLKSQYRVVVVVFVLLTLALAVLAFLGLNPWWSVVGVPLAGFLSALAGWFGMRMATSASARTAAAAKASLNDGLTVAFRSGAVMGLTVVGLAILDVSFWFFLFMAFRDQLGIPAGELGLQQIVAILISYKVGASLQALFARVGGGIFTKAADVGADLVGKVEAGIPEDDPRNPAVVADNVGDNVGDVAGMGADLYESYYSSIIAALGLGVAAALASYALADAERLRLAFLLAAAPLALAGIGIFASIIGIFTVRTSEESTFKQLLAALNRGVYIASAFVVLAALAVPYVLLGMDTEFAQVLTDRGIAPWWSFSIAIVAGLVSGLVIARWTEYSTSYEYAPTRRIAIQAHTGPATVIIAGIAEGMKSTWASLVAVVVAIIVAFVSVGGADNFLMGLYGIGIAAVGMLSTLGITLATDAYGPIADNAGGNAEMSGQPPHVRQRTDMLDSLGNTTAATGKGFAIGSAALTALALLAAYVQVVQTQLKNQAVDFGAARMQQVTPAELQAAGVGPGEAYATYIGYGRFSVIGPGLAPENQRTGGASVLAALLTDRNQFANPRELDHMRPGHILRAVPFAVGDDAHHGDGHTPMGAVADTDPPNVANTRSLVLSTRFDHGDHGHDMEFEVISLRHGTIQDVLAHYDVTLTSPQALGGVFLGVMLMFLFCALTMNAVGRAAYRMMNECRRQFGLMRRGMRERGMTESETNDPDNWPKSVTVDGHEYPDYETCVTIATGGALREMIIPSMLAIAIPLAVGLVLGVPGVVGLLAGGLTSGFAVAVFMANAGGAWDNAKKLLESYGRITADEFLDNDRTRDRVPEEIRESLLARAEDMRRAGRGSAYVYGKGSDDHKATVVGDTVGDPFKDTSGPSLNILIKLLSSVAVVFAGLTVKFGPIIGTWIGLN